MKKVEDVCPRCHSSSVEYHPDTKVVGCKDCGLAFHPSDLWVRIEGEPAFCNPYRSLVVGALTDKLITYVGDATTEVLCHLYGHVRGMQPISPAEFSLVVQDWASHFVAGVMESVSHKFPPEFVEEIRSVVARISKATNEEGSNGPVESADGTTSAVDCCGEDCGGAHGDQGKVGCSCQGHSAAPVDPEGGPGSETT